MEVVVLNSEIARLVFGYLKNQRLERASQIFCKTSPYLLQEFCAFEQGLQTYSFLPQLEEIIREYVKIKSSVENAITTLPLAAQLHAKNLPDKILYLLERIQSSECNKDDLARGGTSVQSDKENTAIKLKRKIESFPDLSDDRTASCHRVKRRRVLEPFCFLSGKTTNISQQVKLTNSYPTIDDDVVSENSITEEIAIENDCDDDNAEDFTATTKPTKESTPRSHAVKSKNATLSLPDISQVLLDNREFQLKLVENINQALNSSSSNDENQNVQEKVAEIVENSPVTEEQKIVSGNQLLDQMVLNILDATANDPTFDKIIEDVIGSSNKSVSAGVQCNIQDQPSIENIHPVIMPPRTPLFIRNAMVGGSVGAVDQDIVQVSNTSFGSLIDPNFSISKLIVVNSNESAQKQCMDQNVSNTTTTDQQMNPLASSHEFHLDDQVCFDASTGQLTFPLFLTNDGLLANFPFLVNNELVTQQLQPENIANMDVSRIEIPLAEPIKVSVDQLPPNAIILGSNQKAKNDEAQEHFDQGTEKKLAGEDNVLEKRGGQMPSSLDSRILFERVTPSTSGVVHTKTCRSLSTPRRRAPHVRALTFSPRSSMTALSLAGTTPLSSRKNTVSRLCQGSIVKAKPSVTGSKPVIKNVEILPRLPTVALDASTNNDSSNSCNVPKLFAGDESSNQTVIRNEVSPPAATTHHSDSNTPKRKQMRHAAVRACKRQLSKTSSNANDDNQTKTTTVTRSAMQKLDATRKCSKAGKNKKTVNKQKQDTSGDTLDDNQELQKQAVNSKNENDRMIDEWQRIRKSTAHDLDLRLRELNSQREKATPKHRVAKRKPRRKNIQATKVKPTKETKKKNNIDVCSEVEQNDIGAEEQVVSSESAANISEDKMEGNEYANVVETAQKADQQDKADQSVKCPKEFSVRIVTPQHFEKRESKNEAKAQLIVSTPEEVQQSPAFKTSAEIQVTQCSTTSVIAEQELRCAASECEKRTANIACLLETPFKDSTTQPDMMPKTPGIFASALDTPAPKVCEGTMHSTSFLFGSLTKSELDTPLLNAVTPSMPFTPFSAKDVTPRSGIMTEYSSGGGSYYRPDESDDLDRNFDKMLRDSGKKRINECTVPKVATTSVELIDKPAVQPVEKTTEVCVEIPVETLKVEPIVLKRVKSFGSEAELVENTACISPHYTLAGGLPDFSAEEAESSSSSSSSCSSSSSSCSSSSSTNTSTSLASSSHSATSSSKPNRSSLTQSVANETATKSGTGKTTSHEPLTKPPDNLSDISSTEDEEWQRIAANTSNSSQLVNIDGEVRYPVRSWLTPCKVQAAASAPSATIKVMLPLKSAEKPTVLASNELEQKRLRVKEKLRQENLPKASHRAKVNTMHEKTRRTAIPLTKVCPPTPKEEEHRSFDVLTALNLSARKKGSHVAPVQAQVPPPPGEINDNAVSTVFSTPAVTANASADTKSSSTRKLTTPMLPKLINSAKPSTTSTAYRKCLEIEPRAAPIGKRLVDAKQKKASEALPTATTEKNTNFSKKLNATPKIRLKSATKITKSKRVSPRLHVQQNSSSKVDGGDVNKKEVLEKKIKVTKKAVPIKMGKNCKKLKAAEALVDLAHSETYVDAKKKESTAAAISSDGAVSTRQNTNVSQPKPITAKIRVKTDINQDARIVKNPKTRKEITECSSSLQKKEKELKQTVPLQALPIQSSTNMVDMKPVILDETKETNLKEDEIDESFEEEDLIAFGFVSLTEENQSKCYFKYVHNENETQTENRNQCTDLNEFKMVVNYEDGEKHNLCFTDDICLYSNDPVQSISALSKAQSISKNQRNVIDNITALNKTEQHYSPVATSTPVVDKTISMDSLLGNDSANSTKISSSIAINDCDHPQKLEHNRNVNKSKKSQQLSNQVTTTNPAEKIQIEDIESILSRLHPNK